jgi:TatD DNase family protein
MIFFGAFSFTENFSAVFCLPTIGHYFHRIKQSLVHHRLIVQFQYNITMASASNHAKQNCRNTALAAAIPSLAAKVSTSASPSNRKKKNKLDCRPRRQVSLSETDSTVTNSSLSLPPRVIDIGVNLTHASFHKNWKAVVQRSIQSGVDTLILTGTSIQVSKASLDMAQEWYDETGTPNLWVTVGVHPHHAKEWNSNTSVKEMKALLQHPFAVAVGECGLDYNRHFSTPQDQKRAFREQLQLAVELNLPVFCHEREAHDDFNTIVEQVQEGHCINGNAMPAIVTHCFTGTKEEALDKIQRGHFIGFTGTICKQDRGAPLRDLLPFLPLEKLMVETDAPYMGWKTKTRGDSSGNKKKRGMLSSEPADCTGVAERMAQVMGVSHEEVCTVTTATAMAFFRLEEKSIELPKKVASGN